jgi:hypothetical protein
MNNINPQYIWIAASAIGALIVIGLVAMGVRRAQSQRLQEHFGREYNRTVEATGSRTAAERELAGRAKEVKQFDIRQLSAAERDRYRVDWKRIEGRFIDHPTMALSEAEEMIDDVMRTRGYPVADFEAHASHLSVKHPNVVEHYRAGHAVLARGTASTEEQRQAMLHFRELFEELVGRGGTDVAQDIAVQREVAAEEPRAAAADRIEREGELRK